MEDEAGLDFDEVDGVGRSCLADFEEEEEDFRLELPMVR